MRGLKQGQFNEQEDGNDKVAPSRVRGLRLLLHQVFGEMFKCRTFTGASD